MENLLTPDKGLIIWTIVTFACLVLLLGKVAWKPLLQALKDREQMLSVAIDAAQMGTWDRSLISDEVRWSDRSLAIFGLTPGANFSYAQFLDRIQVEDRVLVVAKLARSIREQSDFEAQFRIFMPYARVPAPLIIDIG